MYPFVRNKVEGEFQAFRWKQFQRDNDNFQMMAAATVSMWGTYTKDQKLVEDARGRLEDFKTLLTRRGIASEPVPGPNGPGDFLPPLRGYLRICVVK